MSIAAILFQVFNGRLNGEEGDKKNALIQPLQVNLRFEREDLRGSDQYI